MQSKMGPIKGPNTVAGISITSLCPDKLIDDESISNVYGIDPTDTRKTGMNVEKFGINVTILVHILM